MVLEGMSETVWAWAILIGGFFLPLLHVALSAKSGPWRPPPDSRCPLGPRPGWLVMVLLLGPIGWLLFMTSRYRRGRHTESGARKRPSA